MYTIIISTVFVCHVYSSYITQAGQDEPFCWRFLSCIHSLVFYTPTCGYLSLATNHTLQIGYHCPHHLLAQTLFGNHATLCGPVYILLYVHVLETYNK